MKCKDCGQSYVNLNTTCSWSAYCNALGSSEYIGECEMSKGICDGYGCDNQEAPEWDCDLGQSNQYCIHYNK